MIYTKKSLDRKQNMKYNPDKIGNLHPFTHGLSIYNPKDLKEGYYVPLKKLNKIISFTGIKLYCKKKYKEFLKFNY